MKKIKGNIAFVLILVACVIFMIWYSMGADSLNVASKGHGNIDFSDSERNFAEEKKTVTLEVAPELDYMERGFIEEYIQSIIEPIGMTVRLVNEGTTSNDGKLVIVNDELRAQADEYQFTSPVLEIEGSIFVSTNYSKEQGILDGVCVKGDFSDSDKYAFKYAGNAIRFTEVDTVEDAVVLAGEKKLDCIAGEQNAIAAYLREQGIEQQYQNQFADLYIHNVCLMLPLEDTTLYSILNKCIHHADLPVLARQAQENWFGIADSFVRENNFKDAAALIIIIFAAVIATFFFYYKSNKNLYDELKSRMDQLLASKQEMRTTFNGVSYYMAELDSNGFILDINTAFYNYVNTECVGRTLGEVLELQKEAEDALNDIIIYTKKTGSGSSKEIIIKRRIFEVNVFPIRENKGDIEKLLFMAIDVTGERTAERQMLQDNKMIAVGQLAAGVAHEIRNPLGIIRNYCYVLKNMKDEETQKQAIQVIEKSVDTAGNIIDNLLNFSKISNLKVEDVYIKKHIDDVIALNKGLMKKKKITVDVLCQEDFKVNLAVESFDMIFINLVTNAIDAMVESGHLHIDISRTDEEFSVSVSDNGMGIEEDILEEIFNPFFTTKSTVEGNGLGLYIVYNEIQKMNGEIDVISEVGKGTTFTVTLPFRMEEETIE